MIVHDLRVARAVLGDALVTEAVLAVLSLPLPPALALAIMFDPDLDRDHDCTPASDGSTTATPTRQHQSVTPAGVDAVERAADHADFPTDRERIMRQLEGETLRRELDARVIPGPTLDDARRRLELGARGEQASREADAELAVWHRPDETPESSHTVSRTEAVERAALALNAAILDAALGGLAVECLYVTHRLPCGEVTLIDTVRSVRSVASHPGLGERAIARMREAARGGL